MQRQARTTHGTQPRLLPLLLLPAALLLWPGGCLGLDYLIPFLWYGPHNQVNEIKETLALSRLLGGHVTVVLSDLLANGGVDGGERPMGPIEALFDVAHLRRHYRVALLSELRRNRAWARRLDAVAVLTDTRTMTRKVTATELWRPLKMEPTGDELWFRSPVSAHTGCTHEHVEELRTLLAPHRSVAVQTFHSLLDGSHWMSGGPPGCGGNPCCEAFRETFCHLRKAQRIVELARAFVQQHVGEGPYVAVHLGPCGRSGRACSLAWARPGLAEQARWKVLHEECKNPYLYYRFTAAIKYLCLKYNTTRVFAMAMPDVRPAVASILTREGVRAAFMDREHMAGLNATGAFRWLSRSLMSFVEQEVAVRAAAFLGTHESTVTSGIVQERMGMGVPLEHSYTMVGHANFSHRPVDVLEFYGLYPKPGGDDKPAWDSPLVRPWRQAV